MTRGTLIFAAVRKSATPGVTVDGGEGVGRVTKPGLDQPVGAAAINSVPRKMIEENVREVCMLVGYDGGIDVTISAPGARALAKRHSTRASALRAASPFWARPASSSR